VLAMLAQVTGLRWLAVWPARSLDSAAAGRCSRPAAADPCPLGL